MASRQQRRENREKTGVTFDEVGVTRIKWNGRVERVRWEALELVEVLRPDFSPIEDDVVWVLTARGGKRGVAMSASEPGAEALVERLKQLPGFDETALERARASGYDVEVVAWRLPAPAEG